jgi:5-methylcytosine-specific restriction endonuclease McrA
MAIDYSGCAIPKGTPRVVDRVQKKRDLERQMRDCRRAVKARDKGKCVIPGCRDASVHLHHITYRSRGGKWRSKNVCSLCVTHHQMVHAALIHISGNADEHLTITGSKSLLGFRL